MSHSPHFEANSYRPIFLLPFLRQITSVHPPSLSLFSSRISSFSVHTVRNTGYATVIHFTVFFLHLYHRYLNLCESFRIRALSSSKQLQSAVIILCKRHIVVQSLNNITKASAERYSQRPIATNNGSLKRIYAPVYAFAVKGVSPAKESVRTSI